MEYRNLGRSGLQVSVVGLGCNNFGGRTDAAGTAAVVNKCIEMGITLFDTADAYGRGRSEEFMAPALKPHRNSIVLATKAGVPMGEGPYMRGTSRKYLLDALENSLRRLETDYIDLYQMHVPDANTPIEETMRAYDDLVKQGKVRFVGCSNYTGDQLAEAVQASQRDGLVEYVTLQPHWSLVERLKFEVEIYPTVKIYGLGIIPYSPLGKGFLTGKYRRSLSLPDSKRAEAVKTFLTNKNFILLDRLDSIAQAHGKTVSQIALAWLLSREQVVSVIIGANTVEQLTESLGASGVWLSNSDMNELIRLSAW